MKMHLKNPYFYLMLLGDAILFAGALVLAYLFRFEFSLEPSLRSSSGQSGFRYSW